MTTKFKGDDEQKLENLANTIYQEGEKRFELETTGKASGSESKRQKKVMTSHEKVQLLDMLQEGKSYAAARRCYDVN
ncbi:Hypothetical predicted protein [Octopus vulgaris]|uniref:HTH psq-type domain-containing protein n=1 Tax=Octopus vulgaris TaxID=6645 RepID=A0AA36FAD1_OCTVU|nr:Hypothetical predicted protein [Octopus vulgaris]